MEQLRKEEGATLPIGAAGFCWGGKFVVLLANGAENTIDSRPLIDVGFTGHPSFLKLPDEIEKMTLPVSFAIGDGDNQVPLDKAKQIKPIIEGKPGNAKGELVTYANTTHGFAVRAVLTDEDTAKTAADAEEQALNWFNTHFKFAS